MSNVCACLLLVFIVHILPRVRTYIHTLPESSSGPLRWTMSTAATEPKWEKRETKSGAVMSAGSPPTNSRTFCACVREAEVEVEASPEVGRGTEIDVDVDVDMGIHYRQQ